MKRLVSVLVALLFVSGMAMAQNSSTTNQNGDDNDAEVNQTVNTGGSNSSLIDQNGNDLDADVDQVTWGAGTNSSDIKQGNAAADLHVADVDQTTYMGGSNTSDLDQVNNSHYAEVEQETGRMDLEEAGANSSNTSIIYQGGHAGIGQGSDVFVFQKATLGGSNTSTITQHSTNSLADVTQYNYGTEMVSEITQIGNDRGSGNNHTAIVYQVHQDNTGMAESYITQDGENNIANVEQHAFSGAGDNISRVGQYGGENGSNEVDVDQTLNGAGNNESNIAQGNGPENPNGDLNRVDLDQTTNGGNNDSDIEQVNNSHYAKVKQETMSASSNTAEIYQGGHSPIGEGGYIDVNQYAYGGENHVNINQHATAIANSAKNTEAWVDQYAYNNGINEVDIDQFDKNNYAEVYQNYQNLTGGLTNSAVIEQYGNGQNTSIVNQIGAGNTATTIQTNF